MEGGVAALGVGGDGRGAAWGWAGGGEMSALGWVGIGVVVGAGGVIGWLMWCLRDFRPW
jgi:hypothetical protein